ncbi:MAG: hypothetical protein IK093_09490 [Ruminiclostridium sp.]|nr:hypothetical protein [Ruminiclostridium sp.]
MKRIAALLLCIAAAIFCGIRAYAMEQTYTLTMENRTGWSGTPLTYIANRGDYFCLSDPSGSAYIELDAGDAVSVYAYFDAGNYEGRGTTSQKLEYLDDGGAVIGCIAGEITANGKYARYEYGSQELYTALPEGTKRLRFALSGGSAYLRNLNITLSSIHAYEVTSDEGGWNVSGALDNVEINTSALDHWILVGFVFAVALIMMISVKIRNGYKKGK